MSRLADGPRSRHLGPTSDVVLADGGTVHLRPITPADRDELARFHESLSDETRFLRFFAPYPHLSQRDLDRFTTVDNVSRVALVATLGDRIVAVGRYECITPGEAELAFTVRDDQQNRGIGSVLLEHLALIGRTNGVERFVAEVIPTNRRMIATFVNAGFVPEQEIHDGIARLSFRTRPTPRSEGVRLAREHTAESRSIARLLHPDVVAVVGVSRTGEGTGALLLRHIIDGGYRGHVVAVNEAAGPETAVLGVPVYPSLQAIGGPVDLVVVAVPAQRVPEVARDAGAVSARGMLVVSAGFAEADMAGRELQRGVIALARGAGVRVIGPAALGVVNTDPAVCLNAALSPRLPIAGHVGLFAQSASLGAALLERADRRGVGVSTFVSAGNRGDVSGNDVMQYWRDDPQTHIALLYLESIGNPRKFTRIARELGADKPVVAMRSSRSHQQAHPLGHQIRRTMLPPTAVDSLFAQSGVIPAASMYELFDIALVLDRQPLPGGAGVAIVSNSDAHAVMAVDALEAAGLVLRGWPAIIEQEDGRAEYAMALAAALEDPAVDTILAIQVPGTDAMPDLITDAARHARKPVVAALIASTALPQGRDSDVPCFDTVDEATRALAAVTEYSAWRRVAHEPPVELADLDARRAARAVAELGGGGDGWRSTTDGSTALGSMLASCGIVVLPAYPVISAKDAVAMARAVGYPVSLAAPDHRLSTRVHATSVRLDLTSDRGVRDGWRSLTAELGSSSRTGRWLQQMAPRGLECHVSSIEDPRYGPVVGLTVGGAVPLQLGDVVHRIPPLRPADIEGMLAAPRVGPLLRYQSGAARALLADLLVRVGLLADAAPELAELSIGPIHLGEARLTVLRARARIAIEPAPRTDRPARRLL